MAEFFRVEGKSMLPTLRSHDVLLTFLPQNIKKEDVVVVQTHLGLVVKRIHEFHGETVTLRSDNNVIESSICNTPIAVEDVVAKVHWRFRLPLSFARL
jgi:phage repressor protein C with HTH and peptisase S24 domain|tara:strand:+ start:1131 stop:1424 length:294 start_codon:yes stop_codon:yes gene_type:complete